MNILYEDNHLIAVLKPAGVLSQGDETGDATIQDEVKAYIKEKYHKPGEVFLGLVHRLDRPVSGVLLLARTSKAASRLVDQFRRHTTKKTYLALVVTPPPAAEDVLTHHISWNEASRKAFVRETPEAGSLQAELKYRVLGGRAGAICLEIELLTGRHHQIRAQLAFIGSPILGDVKYGGKFWKEGRVALHAKQLVISHPTLKTEVCIEAPLPKDWPTGWEQPSQPARKTDGEKKNRDKYSHKRPGATRHDGGSS